MPTTRFTAVSKRSNGAGLRRRRLKGLQRLGRHPWRPAHLHFLIKAPGYETLITHVVRSDDVYLDSDAVFAVKDSLICDFVAHDAPDAAAAGLGIEPPFCTLDFDFVLTPVGRR